MCAILTSMEDRMARHLKLRPLTRNEQRVLRSKLRDLTLSVRVHQRYRVIDQIQRGFSLLETAERVGCHFTVAYDWTHRFNESGFASFEQVPNPKGRPPILRAAQLRELVEVALSSPSERGLPFSVWSVPNEAGFCRRENRLTAGNRRVGPSAATSGRTHGPAGANLEDLERSGVRP